MLEPWRRVVIVSAVAVYIAGLACAGSLLVGRIEAGAGLLRGSPIARRLPPGRARTGRRDGEPVMRADDFIAVPASDAGAAAQLSAPVSVLATLRADPRQAIQEDSIRCLVCAGVFRQLTNTHLRGHGLSAAEYKTHFGYNRGRPLMCRTLARMYADRARSAGLAARIRQRPILLEPELRRRGGARSISLEELLTRREIRQREAVQRTESSVHIVG
jgi:predicted transcriptional regulator